MARFTSRRVLLLLGGAALAAGLIARRDRVTALLPGGSSTSTPPPPPAAARREEAASPAPSPGVSNYDVAGPAANTATAVPVPEAFEPETIDEAAEEAAAAAEAASIGGTVADYAGPAADEPATEADRPLAEAGEGVSEGQEQAEAELESAAQPADGRSPEQAQIEDAIERQDEPGAGETLEPIRPVEDRETGAIDPPASVDAPDDSPRPSGSAETPRGGSWGPGGWSPPSSAAGREPERSHEGDWQTWSGRSIEP
jgi:hypothetical protein